MTDTIDDARTSAGLIEDTYESGSDGVQRRRPYAVFMRWTRRVHMYAGLFMLPWVLMYGTSALFFNHADLLPNHEVRDLRIDDLEGSALASLPEPAVYAERLVEAMRARGLAKGDDLHLLDPEQARFVGIVHVTVEGADARHELFVDVTDGDGLVRSFSTAAGEEIPALRQVSSLDIEDSLKLWLETNAMELIESKGMWAERAIHRNGPSVEFQVTAGGEPWRITYDVGTRAFRADPLERRLGSISVRNLLTSLHTTHGFPPEMRSRSFWALAVDCMGAD